MQNELSKFKEKSQDCNPESTQINSESLLPSPNNEFINECNFGRESVENFNFYNPGQKNIIKKEFNLSLNSYTRKKNYSYQKPINLSSSSYSISRISNITSKSNAKIFYKKLANNSETTVGIKNKNSLNFNGQKVLEKDYLGNNSNISIININNNKSKHKNKSLYLPNKASLERLSGKEKLSDKSFKNASNFNEKNFCEFAEKIYQNSLNPSFDAKFNSLKFIK